MIHTPKLVVSAVLVLSTLAIAGFHQLSAQTSPSGLAVSPPTFELSANPGDVIKNSIRVDNLTDRPQKISTDKRNFTALGEEGQVNLTEEDVTFSLASWISVSPSSTTIPAKESKTFEYTVTVPPNAEPGGRFGSIIFKTAAKPVEGQTGVAVGQEIGALLFLKIAGDVTEKADIVEFAADKNFYEYGPVNFNVRVKNEGSVHFKPTGTITITNIFGKQVANVPVDSRNVLPDAIRKMNAEWKNKWMFGRYTATASLVYGSDNQIITSSTSFYGFPYKLMLVVLLVVLVLAALVYRGRKRIKRALRALGGRD